MSISAYKGKISTLERGWSLLPAELLQYVVVVVCLVELVTDMSQDISQR